MLKPNFPSTNSKDTLPEHNPTKEDIAETEEHEADKAEELASREAPNIPAQDRPPAESEVAKGEVTAVAAPAGHEAPADDRAGDTWPG